MNFTKQPGRYSGRTVSYELFRPENKPTQKGFRITVALEYMLGPTGEWVDVTARDECVVYVWWLYTKDGGINGITADQICAFFPDWEGNWSAFGNNTVADVACMVDVEQEGNYCNGKRMWRADQDPPGERRISDPAVTAELAKEIDLRHGSEFRARIGNLKRAAPAAPPASKPDGDAVPF